MCTMTVFLTSLLGTKALDKGMGIHSGDHIDFICLSVSTSFFQTPAAVILLLKRICGEMKGNAIKLLSGNRGN